MSVHLVLVSADHQPDHGGLGAATSLLVRAAVDAGWRVDLVTRDGERHPPGARIHAVRTADTSDGFADRLDALRYVERIRPYRYGLFALAAARALLRLDARPDVIEFIDTRAEGFAAVRSARVRRRFRGVPMVVHAHTPMFVEDDVNGADPRRFGRHVYHRWERQALAAADGVITTSRRLAEVIGRRDAGVIPYPLFTPARLPSPAAPPPGWGAGLETILCVGTLNPRKGVDTWVRSLNRVFAARPGARAELIGADTMTAPDGGSMAEHLPSLLAPALRGRLRVRGRLPHAETLRAIAASSLVVAPSRFDSFGLAAAEAVLMGTPLVVSDRVGLGEHVAGLAAVPAGDAAALAAEQVGTLAEPAAAARRAKRTRDALIAGCDPAEVIRRRAAFVRASQAAPAVPRPGPDAIDRLDGYLRAIDRKAARSQLV